MFVRVFGQHALQRRLSDSLRPFGTQAAQVSSNFITVPSDKYFLAGLEEQRNAFPIVRNEA